MVQIECLKDEHLSKFKHSRFVGSDLIYVTYDDLYDFAASTTVEELMQMTDPVATTPWEKRKESIPGGEFFRLDHKTKSYARISHADIKEAFLALLKKFMEQ